MSEWVGECAPAGVAPELPPNPPTGVVKGAWAAAGHPEAAPKPTPIPLGVAEEAAPKPKPGPPPGCGCGWPEEGAGAAPAAAKEKGAAAAAEFFGCGPGLQPSLE